MSAVSWPVNTVYCPLQAKCIKTGPGSHSCQCLAGWREDGDECQPINNCNGPDRGGCHPNATCIYVGPGQVMWPCELSQVQQSLCWVILYVFNKHTLKFGTTFPIMRWLMKAGSRCSKPCSHFIESCNTNMQRDVMWCDDICRNIWEHMKLCTHSMFNFTLYILSQVIRICLVCSLGTIDVVWNWNKSVIHVPCSSNWQSDCSCKSGYKGNGRMCEAVNQCVTADGGCHYLVSIINMFNYRLMNRDDEEADGTFCVQASCRLLSSGWTCICDENTVGDGHICYGTVEQVSPERPCCCLSVKRCFCVCTYFWCFQELMALPDAGEFFTWTTVSIRLELTNKDMYNNKDQFILTWWSVNRELYTSHHSYVYFHLLKQESGLTWSLVNQNITVLVPSSAAIAKMSPEDKKFWTLKGNLLSLIRSHDRNWF